MRRFEKFKSYLYLLIPIMLIIAFRWIATLIKDNFTEQIGIYMWIPFVASYWVVLSAIVVLGSSKKMLTKRFQAPENGKGWSRAAVLVSFIGFGNLILMINYYSKINILIPGIILSIINPWIEESFWRGYLLEKLSVFPKVFSIIYINIGFALLHLLTIGVISSPNRELIILPITFIVGVIWSVAYLKTRSLRYVVVGHFLMDIFGFASLFIV